MGPLPPPSAPRWHGPPGGLLQKGDKRITPLAKQNLHYLCRRGSVRYARLCPADSSSARQIQLWRASCRCRCRCLSISGISRDETSSPRRFLSPGNRLTPFEYSKTPLRPSRTMDFYALATIVAIDSIGDHKERVVPPFPPLPGLFFFARMTEKSPRRANRRRVSQVLISPDFLFRVCYFFYSGRTARL